MTPGDRLPLNTEIADYAEILGAGAEPPVVVGGHAAGLWARYFLDRGVKELAEFLPFRSKDLDLFGTSSLLTDLHSRFRGDLRRSEPRSPVIGRLDVHHGSKGFLRVEVLHVVQGLNADDLRRTVDLRAGDVVARVPLVQLVLKSKIANAATINQERRQDVKHVRMLVPCVRAFTIELIEELRSGGITERTLINVLEEIRTIVDSSDAEKVNKLWDVDLAKVWPMEELQRIDGDKIARRLEHRFP